MASMVAIVPPANWKYWMGGTMPEIENVRDSAQHCFELANSSDFLGEDVAVEAFELLTANQYDHFAAHALGVSL